MFMHLFVLVTDSGRFMRNHNAATAFKELIKPQSLWLISVLSPRLKIGQPLKALWWCLPSRRDMWRAGRRGRKTLSRRFPFSLPTRSVTGEYLGSVASNCWRACCLQSLRDADTVCARARLREREIAREGPVVHINSAGEKRRESTHSQYRLFWYTHLFLQTILFPWRMQLFKQLCGSSLSRCRQTCRQ